MKDEAMDININNLLLDTENFRHGAVQNQSECIYSITRDDGDKLLNLARSILENGFNPSESLIAYKPKNSEEKYIVVEGNRRLCALKILANPTLVKDLTISKAFNHLSADPRAKKMKAAPVYVAANLVEARMWARLKHAKGNDGAGVLPWGAMATARSDQSQGKFVKSLYLIEYLLQNSDLDSEVRRIISGPDFFITNFDRIITSGSFAALTQINWDETNHSIYVGISQDQFNLIIESMVTIVATGTFNGSKFNVNDVRTAKDRNQFLKMMLKEIGLGETKKVKPWKLDKWQSSKKGPRKLSNTKTLDKEASGEQRKNFISKDQKFTTSNSKFNQAYKEFQKLKTTDCDCSIAFLLRFVIETTFANFIEYSGIELPEDSKGFELKYLKTRMEYVRNYIKSKKLDQEFDLTGLNIILSNPRSTLNPTNLNNVVHDSITRLNVQGAMVEWDLLFPLIKKFWEEIDFKVEDLGQ
jgi:hypothetical protein